MKLVLASSSPRRLELLSTLGIPFDVVSPRFRESPTKLPPREEALFFAKQKAQSVASDHPNALILASDTLIACEGQTLGKPRDETDAKDMLKLLSGKMHRLFTAVALLNTADQSLLTHVEEVQVTFKPLTDETMDEYIATGEPMGKAGAYAAQGIGKKLISNVEGDINAVIGLPLEPIRKWLKERL